MVMDPFARIVNRLRPPLPALESGHPPPAPPTLAELHEMLDSVIIDRAAAEATILGAPAARDALLDMPGTDKAIRKLDTDVDAAHLLIERLDRVRPELDVKILAATAATRADAWAVMRTRLLEQITICAGVMEAAETIYIQTCELRLAAQRAGFTAETAVLPYHSDLFRVSSEVMRTMRSAIRAQPLIVPAAPTLWNVKFLAWTSMYPGTPNWTGYMEGQEAGFDAATAWALVDAGKADWTSKLRPPKPRKPRKSRKPEPVPAAEAAIFGAGPADPVAEFTDGGRRVRHPAKPPNALSHPGTPDVRGT